MKHCLYYDCVQWQCNSNIRNIRRDLKFKKNNLLVNFYVYSDKTSYFFSEPVILHYKIEIK